MDLEAYLERLEMPADFSSTGITKETYLDVMESAFLAYSDDQLVGRRKLDGSYLELHSYARLANVLACLLGAGRMRERLELGIKMLTDCCREVAAMKKDINADFAVKEIMLAIRWLKPVAEPDTVRQWLELMRSIGPYSHYKCTLLDPADKYHLFNINIYSMVGEYLREAEGLTDTTDYFASHWPGQLVHFDENGMYKDPGCPMLYDVTTRCQIQLMLGLGGGYSGPFADELDRHLRKAGLMTLFTQSVAGELPFGGRSSQFLFNEVLIAANCEYEAARYRREGREKLATAFKRAGHLAVRSIGRWLHARPPRHIKNFYPPDSRFGTEPYGFYDKYMITMAAFLTIAYLYADDSIGESPCPAETGGYVLPTSESFRQLFANAGGYSLQIATRGDWNYDATGLGRLHKAGFPTELALSVPLTKGKGYELADGLHRDYSGISPGWQTETGEIRYLAECQKLQSRLDVVAGKIGASGQVGQTGKESDSDEVLFSVEYEGEEVSECGSVSESYRLNGDGLLYRAAANAPRDGKLYVKLPLLVTNGESRTTITTSGNGLEVAMGSYVYTVKWNANVRCRLDEQLYGNRNGTYRLAFLESDVGELRLSLSLTRRPVTIYLAGDSTVASFPDKQAPLTGWGQVIQGLFAAEAQFRNKAMGGRSSKSFIEEGALARFSPELKAGDYLFIQFGHNDEKPESQSLYTEPETTYKQYLRQYIDFARAAGAIPVLVTSVQRRSFAEDGSLTDTHRDYAEAMRRLAAEEGVALLDLAEQSKRLFEQAGPDGTLPWFVHLAPGEHPNFPEGKSDNTHFNREGALQIARLVIRCMRQADLPLAEYVKEGSVT